MRHITYAQKSLIVGDEAALAITEYAAALARAGSADTVTLNAYGADGADVEATFVLDSGTVLMAETSRSSIPEPDNARVIEYMREKTRLLAPLSPAAPHAVPRDELPGTQDIDGYFDEL